jgi:predicted nucleic acid-binding protein
MPTDSLSIDTCTFNSDDELFIDTNVWLYLYAPQAPGDWKARVYSRALAKILSAKSRIFIDALILSEFINRYTRLAFNLTKRTGAVIEYKDYRNSAEFKPVAREIEATVRRIMKHCQPTDSGFSSCDLDGLLAEFGRGNSDFNDQVMVELCKANGWKLLTHDGDFKDCGLTVLTANKRLLA